MQTLIYQFFKHNQLTVTSRKFMAPYYGWSPAKKATFRFRQIKGHGIEY